ncbi:MAG: DUF2062 domain-containing protein [Alphaproteobacteria bacterium]|nr:DUF2062 domain-containing protein [Alphaproteobacteria bacterium]MCD8570157.1 DUF2062 domain-containing protein [Alphaproteobacteria bacterium]
MRDVKDRAMFKRRKPRSKLHALRELIWPSMGLRRTFRYVRLRIVRMSDTTHQIAGGLSIGIWISFSPLVGLHFVQAGVLAWLFRVNILSSLIGTLVGTPWTFPLMWWASIELGALMTSFFGIGGSHALPDVINMEILWHIATTEPLDLFLPWMIGGYTLGLACAILSYPLLYRLIQVAKAARLRAKLEKMSREGRRITEEA